MDQVLCPKCGKPMSSGFIHAPSGIQWREPGQKPGLWNPIWRAMSNTRSMAGKLFGRNYRENVAWHCADCQMLLVDHSCSLPSKRA